MNYDKRVLRTGAPAGSDRERAVRRRPSALAPYDRCILTKEFYAIAMIKHSRQCGTVKSFNSKIA